MADDAGVDVILVGDSVAMVVLGYDRTTVPVTMDEMLVLTRTVTRAARRPLLIADMPFGSYQVSDAQAVENTSRSSRRRAPSGEARGRRRDRCRACRRSSRPASRSWGTSASRRSRRRSSAASRRRAGRPRRRALLVEDALALEDAGCVRDRARGHAGAGRGADDARCRSRRSASAPAWTATARCSSTTTCSA